MILLDLNQVMIANYMVQIGKHTNIEIDEGLLRHMILNTIRKNNVKFRNDYGDMIITTDARSWRKKIFPYYKFRRAEDKAKSDTDWNALFKVLNKIRDELRDNFPYPVLNVENAEADDIIAKLTFENGKELGGDPILILSGDKDFIQLQRFSNVKQYDPVRKKWLKNKSIDNFLNEHIIRGDKSDGVPNFLSPDDTLAVKSRQKPIMQARLDKWLKELKTKLPKEVFTQEQLRGFERNRQLIDLRNTPADIQENIMKAFNEQSGKDRSKLFNYFITHKLKHLHESIGDF